MMNAHFLGKLFRKSMVGLLGLVYGIGFIAARMPVVSAENVEFQIIPKKEEDTTWVNNVKLLWERSTSWKFREVYNEKADGMKLGGRFASGIMNRDTILDYAAYLVKFIANMALVIGSLMIIYAGYLYATSMYGWDESGKANDAIKRAAIGIAVIIFSYAIMRILISAFL